MRYFAWGLQILILTGGIHFFLRFVRTTRGNPLIRGLFLSVLVGVVGLWGLATVLGLEELQHILESSTGFIVVGLAMIFQPELRRGIAQLGERSFSKPSAPQSSDTLREVVLASRSMASKRDGALIAFERQSSLRTVVETGSAIGARVNARLLESLFHPGGALHDGAVVIRKDRVVAAGCYLPLSNENRLDLSKGTRHRAALGLTEESDAVVVVVSEETGSISIARDGHLTSDVAPDRLEAELRTYLKSNGRTGKSTRLGFVAAVVDVIRNDFVWLAGSMLLACGMWYASYQSIREERNFLVRVVDFTSVGRRAPREAEIIILPPGENIRVRSNSEDDASFKIAVTGSRGQFDDLNGSLRGTLEIEDADWEGGVLDLSQVRWENQVIGLDYRWETSTPPQLVVERFGSKRLQLQPGHIRLDTVRVDPRFEARDEDVRYEPGPTIEVAGPADVIEQLGESLALELNQIVLDAGDVGEVRERIELADHLTARNLALVGEAPVAVIPVQPVRREAGAVRKDVALVCLSPASEELLARWSLPANAHTARLTITTSGMIPLNADPGSPALIERKTAIVRFVEDNLRVYVDVAELPPPDEGRSVRVHTAWVKSWRDYPAELGLETGTLSEWADLEVRLESEAFILLEPRDAPVPDETP